MQTREFGIAGHDCHTDSSVARESAAYVPAAHAWHVEAIVVFCSGAQVLFVFLVIMLFVFLVATS
jgi:hypothetical protein